jgi:hypothetical protein
VIPRKSFAGDSGEEAYLCGLRAGDLSGCWNSHHTVWARLSTTHPAMAELFFRTFREFGRCRMTPDKAFLPGRYCWKLSVFLDSSFAFFVKKPDSIPTASASFYPFFGGYSDCEGSWCIYNDKGSAAVAFVIESKDKGVLAGSAAALGLKGFHPLLYGFQRDSSVEVDTKARLEVRRRNEVRALAEELLPISRHPEKIAKMKLVLESAESRWNRIKPRVQEFKRFVKREVVDFTRLAEIQYNTSRKGTSSKGSSARL